MRAPKITNFNLLRKALKLPSSILCTKKKDVCLSKSYGITIYSRFFFSQDISFKLIWELNNHYHFIYHIPRYFDPLHVKKFIGFSKNSILTVRKPIKIKTSWRDCAWAHLTNFINFHQHWIFTLNKSRESQFSEVTKLPSKNSRTD